MKATIYNEELDRSLQLELVQDEDRFRWLGENPETGEIEDDTEVSGSTEEEALKKAEYVWDDWSFELE